MTHPHLVAPGKAETDLLEPFESLPLQAITLVSTLQGAERARSALMSEPVWGFDTESRPTFHRDQQSDGPHVVQLAVRHHAWVFQLHDPACRAVVAQLLAKPGPVKAGFGLGDDQKRIVAKLGVAAAHVLDLNHVFRQRGYKKDMGVRAAVGVLFNRRFMKSKKAATSNWAQAALTPAQLAYAANDAWAAYRVYEALGLQPLLRPQG
jgi:ribonuclease D